MNKTSSLLATLVVVGVVLLQSTAGWAQVFTPTAPPVVRPDTAETRQVVVSPEAKRSKAAADSAKRTERLFRAFGYQGLRLTRPGKAALLAAILPGAGQVYNRRWWKLPLVYGALGGTIAAEVFYQQRFRQFSDAIDLVTMDPSKIGSDALAPVPRQYKSLEALKSSSGIVYYRGNRDIFYLYIGVAYGLQIVDALVDAHLKDFDVSDDLSLHWQPAMLRVPGQAQVLPTAPGLQLALRVK